MSFLHNNISPNKMHPKHNFLSLHSSSPLSISSLPQIHSHYFYSGRPRPPRTNNQTQQNKLFTLLKNHHKTANLSLFQQNKMPEGKEEERKTEPATCCCEEAERPKGYTSSLWTRAWELGCWIGCPEQMMLPPTSLCSVSQLHLPAAVTVCSVITRE